jgi:uncharacterized protein (UPF0276 family)
MDNLQHELLDRVSVFAEIFESHISGHDYAKRIEINSHVKEIENHLWQLYQEIGNIT